MIKVIKVKNESRPRDKKRNRVVLQIGKRKLHLSPIEAYFLYSQLSRCHF